MAIVFSYARSFRGPIAPRILEPPKLDTTSLAANAPAPILTIWSLFVLNAVDKVSKPVLMFPPAISLAALPAFAASKNARPAPVSIRFTEKVRILRVDRFLRLTTICCPCGGVAYGHPDILTYELLLKLDSFLRQTLIPCLTRRTLYIHIF